MQRDLKVRLLFFLAGALMLHSCHKEYFELERLSGEIEVEPRLVAPLIYGSVSATDLMTLFDSVDYIGEFEDGLIYLAYRDTVISVLADTAIEISDIETVEFYLDTDYDIPVWLPVPIGDTLELDTRSKAVEVEMEGENRLDSILVKGGSLLLNLTSSFKHTGLMTISSQQIRDNFGNIFSTTLPIDDPSGNFSTFNSIPSDSFRIYPIYRNDSNLIFFDFDLALINSGNPISPGEQCVIRVNFDSIDFYEVYGFLDAREFTEAAGEVDIPLWEDNPDLRSVIWADPRLEITSFSSVGIPFEVDFDSVIATGPEGDQVFLNLYSGNTLSFLAPGMDQIGETVTTTIRFNQTTSNIQEFIAVGPSTISYSVDGRTTTTDGDSSHFILDRSRIDMSVEFLLPLDFKSTGFSLSDTVEFAVAEEGVDTSLVRNADFRVTTVNELPVELMLQVFLLDTTYAVLDSVFDDQVPVLGASEVDSNGILIQAVEETNTVEFPPEKLGMLEEVSFMLLRARMITSGAGVPFVKIYSRYTLDYEISLSADFRINSGNQ
jgi:hypothetical protein